MDLQTRKWIEACRRLGAFDREFKTWLDDSKAGEGLQRHGSQIRALETMLKAFRGSIGDLVACADLTTPAAPLAGSANAARLASALFGVWDFFRVKLDQRRNPSYAVELRHADEFAWVCYQPARDIGLKEPPLVFFNGGTSPFVLKRNKRFHADAVPAELMTDESILKATSRLPFPVIGVPWTQMNHPPDAVVIAHEVGHSVEIDLSISTDLDSAIKTALGTTDGAAREKHWKQWRSEIFADLYGCLCVGPAFARAVRDFVAGPKEVLEKELPSLSSSYPPASVRVRFNAAVLEAMGFEAQEQLWPDWQTTYASVPAATAPYLQDAAAVAREMYSTPLPSLSGKAITSLMTFTPDQFELAGKVAHKAAARETIPNTTDLRALFAAVRFAYDTDARGYDRRPEPEQFGGGASAPLSTLERIQKQIAANVADVYRDDPEYSDERDAEHRARGVAWMKSLAS